MARIGKNLQRVHDEHLANVNPQRGGRADVDCIRISEHKKFANAKCGDCGGEGFVKTAGDKNDIYAGWRWCDCAIKNRNAVRGEKK